MNRILSIDDAENNYIDLVDTKQNKCQGRVRAGFLFATNYKGLLFIQYLRNYI